MIRLNLTKMAKGSQLNAEKIGVKKSFVSWVSTYNTFSDKEILEKDKQGYDLIQVANGNTHVRFEWERRNQ